MNAPSRLQQELISLQKIGKLFEARVSLLEQSVEEATLDGDTWREQCSAMSQTLDEMVAVLPTQSRETMFADRNFTRDSRTEIFDDFDERRQYNSVNDVVAFALSLKRGSSWNKQNKMHESELYSENIKFNHLKGAVISKGKVDENIIANNRSQTSDRKREDKHDNRHVLFMKEGGEKSPGFNVNTITYQPTMNMTRQHSHNNNNRYSETPVRQDCPRELVSFLTPGKQTQHLRQCTGRSVNINMEQDIMTTCLFPHNLSPIVPIIRR